MSTDPIETRLPEAFDRVLTRRRIERNMTPEAFAVKADLLDTKAVSIFERGDAPPTLTEFFKIAGEPFAVRTEPQGSLDSSSPQGTRVSRIAAITGRVR